MSQADRERHLSDFVADSYPPPLAQHLPDMPPTTARLNYHDPFANPAGVAPLRAFNPFQSLVLAPAQQRQAEQRSAKGTTTAATASTANAAAANFAATTAANEDSYVSDSDDYDYSDSSTSSESGDEPETEQEPEPAPLPKTTTKRPIKKTVASSPAKPQQQKVAVATQAATRAAPQAHATSALSAVLPAAQQSLTATAVAASPAAPIQKRTEKIDGAPSGVMDQSMAFLKRNFWPILTVIVMLIAIGIAFIFFANRPQANNGANGSSAATAPLSSTLHADRQIASPPPPWTADETGIETAKLVVGNSKDEQHRQQQQMQKNSHEQKLLEQQQQQQQQQLLQKALDEKAAAEKANLDLQKRVQDIERGIEQATSAQQTHLEEIEKLQNMCQQLIEDRVELQQDNNTLAQILQESGLIRLDEQGGGGAETDPEEEPKVQEAIEEKEEQTTRVQQTPSNLINFDDRLDDNAIDDQLDVNAIEESATAQDHETSNPMGFLEAQSAVQKPLRLTEIVSHNDDNDDTAANDPDAIYIVPITSTGTQDNQSRFQEEQNEKEEEEETAGEPGVNEKDDDGENEDDVTEVLPWQQHKEEEEEEEEEEQQQEQQQQDQFRNEKENSTLPGAAIDDDDNDEKEASNNAVQSYLGETSIAFANDHWK